MILTARWILPISRPPICDGFVAVSEDRIVSLGRTAALDSRFSGHSRVDLGDVVLLPGLVNPHTHLELTHYAGRLGPGPLWTWLRGLLALRSEPGARAREMRATIDGASASLESGVTCVGDVSRTGDNIAALCGVPIRKVCFVELISGAVDPPRDPDELTEAVSSAAPNPRMTIGVSPHAPYSVRADHFRETIRRAAFARVPWCTHWAETPEEVSFLMGDPTALPENIRVFQDRAGIESPRMPPVAYLERLAGRAPGGALIHGNYLEQVEFHALSAAGRTLVYCPRAHAFFGHRKHPYRVARRSGVRVALGTDSLASNQSLSVLEEAQFILTQVADPPSPDELLGMITLDAAAAIGLDSEIGSLEPGKAADLVAFACPPSVSDPARFLVESAAKPTRVWISGERVFPASSASFSP